MFKYSCCIVSSQSLDFIIYIKNDDFATYYQINFKKIRPKKTFYSRKIEIQIERRHFYIMLFLLCFRKRCKQLLVIVIPTENLVRLVRNVKNSFQSRTQRNTTQHTHRV